MLCCSENSIMARKSKNPIPKLLELIPYEDTVLSLDLADKMCTVIYEHTGLIVDNSYLMLLIATMQRGGVIQAQEISWATCQGTVILIKRIENGKILKQV